MHLPVLPPIISENYGQTLLLSVAIWPIKLDGAGVRVIFTHATINIHAPHILKETYETPYTALQTYTAHM